jgi:hypothetical protein
MEDQDALFPEAGLGNPTIPSGPSAATILRYQGAINSMLFRCLAILERRRKERMQSGEAFEEQDYINEPTDEAAAEPEAPVSEAAPNAAVEGETLRSAQGDRSDTPRGRLHKRTQKDATDAPLSSEAEVKAENPGAIGDEIGPKSPPEIS